MGGGWLEKATIQPISAQLSWAELGNIITVLKKHYCDKDL